MPMRRSLRWLLLIGVGAALVHVAAVASLPYGIMGRVLSVLTAQAGSNTWIHPPLATDASRTVVRPSPDLAYSSAVFDVSERPLHVVVPLTAPYTSLSGFATNTDNFFALNDQTAGGDPIDVAIVGPGTKRSGLEGLRVVESPSDRGVLLVRRVVPSAAAFPAIDGVRQQARAELLP
jgi:uncharacterized membrane protein